MSRADFWRGKRVLVTGGAGFLGSGLCHALGERGACVTALDAMLPETGAHPANLEGSRATLVVADLRDADLAPFTRGLDAVFNMAAQTSHAGSMADPFTDLAINATAQLRLIAALRAGSPGATVVHASTRQFYGPPRYLPVDEAHPLSPPDANGISKLAGEQYWLLEQKVLGRPVVSLRLTNCYGPRLRVKDARQTFLGIWFRRLLEGEPFEVWGGAQLRDLAYLDDVVEAFLLAAETPACAGRAFNLGGAAPVSLLELARAAVEANGGGSFLLKEFPAERAAIDIGSYHADDGAFRAATGWAPKVSLQEGLRHSLDWFRPRLSAYL
ncbi:NAD-dependent epimerase/dehydratase family protein [Roseomonas marmotae]|uniref:NAD-dependent epimerase/dehydratase family protein n=1 Tax=Roseomonas marmotae TaxID=2768161 RepID=A0ABS3KGA4_9PROT|nr:NAD-dependent epimerase/dehydratase family protein [Roseomonas marmotae]MBO1076499.1 NAD-dependent epimerase/dehydratase family protein [Roseomonas marmotae]QTI77901.1 NAD-dependent epimerase/dehydratase family protein [Roseomonas marmotae]